MHGDPSTGSTSSSTPNAQHQWHLCKTSARAFVLSMHDVMCSRGVCVGTAQAVGPLVIACCQAAETARRNIDNIHLFQLPQHMSYAAFRMFLVSQLPVHTCMPFLVFRNSDVVSREGSCHGALERNK